MYKNKRKAHKVLNAQKLLGIGFLIATVFIIWIASMGTTLEERDGTAAIITLAMGLTCLFSKENWLY